MILTAESNQISSKILKDEEAQDFIAAGVACYAFSLIDEMGILEPLVKGQSLPSDFYQSYPHPLALRSAIQTLECNRIIFLDQKGFSLTAFGEMLARHRSSIGLIYNGYRSVLANQAKIASDQPIFDRDLIDDNAISTIASHMGREFFNQRFLEIIRKQGVRGTIGDLGCGDASTLIYLCRNAQLAGIGFDSSAPSIEKAKSQILADESISVHLDDITNIQGVYPEVEILVQSFVMHDFSVDFFKTIMRSFMNRFPNTKLFLYADAVSPEIGDLCQLPGFDYMHGLLGIKPRTQKETSQLLEECEFRILHKEPIEGLRNCYIWTLIPS